MLVIITTGGDQAAGEGPAEATAVEQPLGSHLALAVLVRMKPHPETAASRRHIVKAAEAFLTARLPDPVAIRHLCGATGVCERTLRNAFYDVLGVSPRQFMLRARLDQVHEALKRRDRQLTVTAIATKYGFYELGRFAARYKVVFGEYPSDTLRAGDGDAESRVTQSGRKTMAA